MTFQDICFNIYSDILPNILSRIYSCILFAFLSGILSGIYSRILFGILPDIFWHSISHIFWHSFGILSSIYSDILSDKYSDILIIISSLYSDILSRPIFWHSIISLSDTNSDILFGIPSDIYSDSLSDIYSDIYLAYLLTRFLLFYHSIWYTFVGSLWSRSGRDHCDLVLWSSACCSGPAGTTVIGLWSIALAVRARQGPLWSSACCSGPAGTALIRGFRVRRGPLRSHACSWGPAGTILILGSQFGGDDCDHELAVDVRWGTLRSSACSWVEVRRARRRKEEYTAGIKSNNPYLASGTKNIRIFGRFILNPLFHTFSALGVVGYCPMSISQYWLSLPNNIYCPYFFLFTPNWHCQFCRRRNSPC